MLSLPPLLPRRHLLKMAGAACGLPLLPGCATPPADVAPAPGTWFIFLERGRPTPPDPPRVQAMQTGHIENFKRLFALGQLTGAGPMRDPSGTKRGIVVVRARSRDELLGYFQPDEYVREGYMNVNAVPAVVQRALNTEGIDASRVEELRIALIYRGAAAPDLAAPRTAYLRRLLDQRTIGAWYTLQTGDIAEVLFAPTKDTAALESALAGYPGLNQQGTRLAVWGQWMSPGVVR